MNYTTLCRIVQFLIEKLFRKIEKMRWIVCYIFISVLSILNADSLIYRTDDILGTPGELKLEAIDEKTADNACVIFNAECERLRQIFDSSLNQSELAYINKSAVGEELIISAEMAYVLGIAAEGFKLTNGRFNIAVEPLIQLWQKAERIQKMPDPSELRELRERCYQSGKFELKLQNGKYKLIKSGEVAFRLDAIAKGFIIQQASKKTFGLNGVFGLMVNIGGDICTMSKEGRHYPWMAMLRSCDVSIVNTSIASSGGTERFYRVKDKLYSHIINVRTGLPVSQVQSASVICKDTAMADMLATALCVSDSEDSLSMINNIQGTECLISDGDGLLFESSGWESCKPSDVAVISFELKNSTPKKKLKRHYTAIWIEDEKGKVVKDLAVWMKSSKTKYLPKLKTWWKVRGKTLLKDKSYFKSISSSSKKPGKYDISWDGTDNNGVKLAPGKYNLCIEVTREHGPNKERPFAVKLSFDSSKPGIVEGEDNVEIVKVSVKVH